MELFRPGLFEKGDPVLYFDLDTVITRNIEHLEGSIDCDLILLRDFYRPQTRMATGMMGWTAGEFDYLYDLFKANAKEWVGRFRSDQEFIQEVVDPKGIRYWQDEYPDQVVSYKVHAEKGLPQQAHVVCFHGKPRPSEVIAGWVRERWSLNHSG